MYARELTDEKVCVRIGCVGQGEGEGVEDAKTRTDGGGRRSEENKRGDQQAVRRSETTPLAQVAYTNLFT